MITLGYNIVHKFPDRLADWYSPDLKNLISKLLNKNPYARPKMKNVFELFPERIQAQFAEPI